MMRTIPGIEFNKGIPEDIDKVDWTYLNGI
jgi:hypothetical protein